MFPRDEQSSNWRIRRKGRLVFLEREEDDAGCICLPVPIRYWYGTWYGTVWYSTVSTVRYSTPNPPTLSLPRYVQYVLASACSCRCVPRLLANGAQVCLRERWRPSNQGARCPFHPLQLTLSTSVQALGWKMHTASRHSGNPTAGPTHPSRPLYVINRTAVPPVLLRK